MEAPTKSLSLPVEGMTCASCVSHVEDALRHLPGVSEVVVNLGTHKASASYNPSRVAIKDMMRAVEDVGYIVPTAELTLDVRGMTCASCVAHVEDALRELEGVTNAIVNLGLNTARVSYIPGVVSASAMKRAVRDVGYEASERSAGADALDRERHARVEEIRQQGRNLLIAGTVGMLVMIGTFYDMLGPLARFVPEFLS